MNSTTISYSAELAGAARAVRARHLAAGSPHLPILDHLWVEVVATLRTAEAFGDQVGAKAAIDRYRDQAIEAIERSIR